MDKVPDRAERDEPRVPHFSCAFCNETSEKPFKICETCGTPQPTGKEDEEE